MGLVLLGIVLLVAGVALVGWVWLMDIPEDHGRVSDRWLREKRLDDGNE